MDPVIQETNIPRMDIPKIRTIHQFLSGNFCPPQGKLPRCAISVFLQWGNFVPAPEKLPRLLRGHKLLRACLKAPCAHGIRRGRSKNTKKLLPILARNFANFLTFSTALVILKGCNFLLIVGSFLLTVELFYLQSCLGAFLFTTRAFLLTIWAFLLTIELLCLQWESVSKKHLNGL